MNKEEKLMEQMKDLASQIAKAKYANEPAGNLKLKFARIQSQHRRLYFARINKPTI